MGRAPRVACLSRPVVSFAGLRSPLSPFVRCVLRVVACFTFAREVWPLVCPWVCLKWFSSVLHALSGPLAVYRGRILTCSRRFGLILRSLFRFVPVLESLLWDGFGSQWGK